MFKKNETSGMIINTDENSFEVYDMARKRAKREIFVVETLKKIDSDIVEIKKDIEDIKTHIGKT